MIIPVLDIMSGMAVSGKSGKRETYIPLKTIFHPSSNPYKIANALKDAGAKRIYIADLDAIENRKPNYDIIKKINQKLPVMLDSGVNTVNKSEEALEIAEKVIIATETLQSVDDLIDILDSNNKDRFIISIDIKDNEIFSKHLDMNIEDIVKKMSKINPPEIILLDISRVGTEKGVNHAIIKKFLKLDSSLIIGGGITSKDIEELEKLGLNKFLVGTALHANKLSI
ncbi:MAG: HisA/HisF family protein [Methanobacterium sp.]|nr:HisA/HisF family protein [Methanobacterium sp.]